MCKMRINTRAEFEKAHLVSSIVSIFGDEKVCSTYSTVVRRGTPHTNNRMVCLVVSLLIDAVPLLHFRFARRPLALGV